MPYSSKAKHHRGTLIIIGGGEDKEDERIILAEVARRVGKGKLCVASVASQVGEELWQTYRKVFHDLGVKKVSHLSMVDRHGPVDLKALRLVKEADAVFFTGGDQLKITNELGGTVVAEEIQKLYASGGLIAGTSAGASVMSETMLVSGPGQTSVKVRSELRMAPGLGFIKDVIIDQHFAERGRISRLIGAVSHNPRYLGVGIDEDTAIVMQGKSFKVMGAGSVYIVDGHEMTECSLSENSVNENLSVFNMKLHVLASGDVFHLGNRQPERTHRKSA
jgi:cyanophycinase